MDPNKSLLKTKLMLLEKEMHQVLQLNRRMEWSRDEINLKIDIFMEDAYRRIKDCMKIIGEE